MPVRQCHFLLHVINFCKCHIPCPAPRALCLPAGLRALQGRKQLEELVKSVKITRDKMEWGPQVGASYRSIAQSSAQVLQKFCTSTSSAQVLHRIKCKITRDKMEWGLRWTRRSL